GRRRCGGCRGGSGGRGGRGLLRLGLRLGRVEHVLLAAAATDTGALHRGQVDVVVLGQLQHERGDVARGGRAGARRARGCGRSLRGRGRLGGLRRFGSLGCFGGLRRLGRRGCLLLRLLLGSLLLGLLLGGLLLRLFLRLLLGRGGAAAATAGAADDCQVGSDLDGLVLLDEDRGQGPGDGGAE